MPSPCLRPSALQLKPPRLRAIIPTRHQTYITTPPLTLFGSVIARASWMVRTWSISGGSGIPLESRLGRRCVVMNWLSSLTVSACLQCCARPNACFLAFYLESIKPKSIVVNPEKESGRVTLITRYGAGKVSEHLAGHIAVVQKSGHPVAWVCDPMHGKWVFNCAPP